LLKDNGGLFVDITECNVKDSRIMKGFQTFGLHGEVNLAV
jgi:hypothetical protein